MINSLQKIAVTFFAKFVGTGARTTYLQFHLAQRSSNKRRDVAVVPERVIPTYRPTYHYRGHVVTFSGFPIVHRRVKYILQKR